MIICLSQSSSRELDRTFHLPSKLEVKAMTIRSSKRRYLTALIVILALILAGCGSLQATESPMTTIGILTSAANLVPVIVGFKAGMTDQGYVEGKNITYLYDGPLKNDSATIDAEIQTLTNKGATLFLVIGTLPSQRLNVALKGTTRSAIFAPLLNPVALGIVDSLTKPGGRMTGVATGGPIVEKGFEWLTTVAPAAKRIYIPYLHDDANATTQLPELTAGAAKLNVELVPQEVKSTDDAVAALSSLSKDTDAVFLVPALFTDPNPLSKYVKAATALGIPVGTSYSAGRDAGALISISTDPPKMGKQAAGLMQHLIHGDDPGTVPVISAEFSYDINLVTAKALGLTVSNDVLSRANTIVRDTGIATPAQ